MSVLAHRLRLSDIVALPKTRSQVRRRQGTWLSVPSGRKGGSNRRFDQRFGDVDDFVLKFARSGDQ